MLFIIDIQGRVCVIINVLSDLRVVTYSGGSNKILIKMITY